MLFVGELVGFLVDLGDLLCFIVDILNVTGDLLLSEDGGVIKSETKLNLAIRVEFCTDPNNFVCNSEFFAKSTHDFEYLNKAINFPLNWTINKPDLNQLKVKICSKSFDPQKKRNTA